MVFQDGFESGALGPDWTVTTTEQGRATVSTHFVPASGRWDLILDDSVDDAIYSVAAATLKLDLLNKKNVVLSFQAKSLGNEPDYGYPDPDESDAVSVSTDSGVSWHQVAWLATVATNWQSFTIVLDDWLGGTGGAFGADFRIRFSEYDNASAPLDGIAIDDVLVTADDDQRAVLEMPSRVLEGTGLYTGYVLLAFPPTNDLTLTLTSSLPEQLVAPASVVVPAGKTMASFSFSVANDDLANLTRTVAVTASAEGVTAIPAYLMILDDDAPSVTLTLPAQLTEGVFTNNNARVVLDRAPVVPYELYFSASPANQINLPYSYVTIPAGQTQAVFTVNAVDDTRIDGNVPVTVTAIAADSGLPVATNQVTTVDNETSALSLDLPAAVLEGSGATGFVRLSGTLATNLQVKLTDSNPAALSVPSTVTVVAGERLAGFLITAPDNAVQEGTRNATISATADGFLGTNRTVEIRDNEVAGYVFGALSNIVDISAPVTLTISAADMDGNVISNVDGSVHLSVVLPDGTAEPLTPSTVGLFEGGWHGAVTLPALSSAPLRLRATDDSGHSGESAPFGIMRVIDLPASDLVWDSNRQRLYASVPADAASTNANHVMVIDPVAATVTGGMGLAQDPGQMVLTSGGEHLYVSLNANGHIAQIDPANMTVASQFAVGTDTNYGTLYAGDMCAVSGQPDLLVVAQRQYSSSGYANGVAVYDHGVVRPLKAIGASDFVEPSANPDVFFGEETEYGNDNLHKLRLNSSGVTNVATGVGLAGQYATGMVAEGDKLFFENGVEVDGAEMKRVGRFPVTGTICPDLALNRVYFLPPPTLSWNTYDQIAAYDPATFGPIRTMSLSSPVVSPKSMRRWGTNGLAFLAENKLVLINSSELIPAAQAADLSVTIAAAPNPAKVNVPLTYTLCISNQGPNIAPNALLQATLSDGQILLNASATDGTAVVSSNTVALWTDDLAAHDSATLTITASPLSAGPLTCVGSVISGTLDPNFTDNTATQFVSVTYQLSLNKVSPLRLGANNLIYDPSRKVLWASVPAEATSPLADSIISIDPATGLLSAPIPVGGNPTAQCMALSANGRYLYVGLAGTNHVCRLDLDSMTTVNIPLGMNHWGDTGFAEDIQPLGGDGTSFLVTDGSDHSIAVFDGMVRRTSRTATGTGTRIASTPNPDVFVALGYYNAQNFNSILVDASGASVTRSVAGLVGGYNIISAGNLVLSSSGDLVDSSSMTLVADFGVSGAPCLDLANHRAYLLKDNTLCAFDTKTLLPAGNFALTVPTPFWASNLEVCVRWGLDGFAGLDADGNVYVFRWSSTIPADVDSDKDGFPDAWEAANFGALHINPAGDADSDGLRNFQEYLYGTSPVQPSADPLRVLATRNGNQTVLHLLFPRRAGLVPRPYAYQISSDLKEWSRADNVTEKVLSTQSVGGVPFERVEAVITDTNSDASFVRFQWR